MHTSASQCSALLLKVLPGLSCPVALLDPAAAVASAQRAAASPRLVPALRLARPANTISYAKKKRADVLGKAINEVSRAVMMFEVVIF